MKLRLAMFLIVLIALVPFLGVQAGKPRPTPYPTPEIQSEAYPVPVMPMQAQSKMLLPNFPGADPRDGWPYTWGYFLGRWWVSIDGIGFQPNLVGVICIIKSQTQFSVCYDLVFEYYESSIGRLWYTNYPVDCRAGTWLVYYATLDGLQSDIRQPNIYKINCVFVPKIFREG